MNPRFILPVSFALTAHVFLLFGLPGRAPVPVAAPTAEPLPTGDAQPKVEIDKPVPANGDLGEPEPAPSPDHPYTPRYDEVPVTRPGGLIEIEIPRLPGIRSSEGTTQIPGDWFNERKPGMGGPDGPVSLGQLDRKPRVRAQPPPIYPRDMRELTIEGSVVVDFWVDEAGDAHDPTVVSATRREFEEAAVRAVARWKFEPGYMNGRRVRFRMSVPLVFKLEHD